MPGRPVLIALSGLPGTGKTTIARALAERIGAVHLRVDTIEDALRARLCLAADVGPAGYMAAYGIAADNLRIGRTVIADSVNPLQISRDAWRSVAAYADTPIIEVEIVCSDLDEHRRRVEGRFAETAGAIVPNWSDVLTRAIDPWDRAPLRIDTAFTQVCDCIDQVAVLLDRL